MLKHSGSSEAQLSIKCILCFSNILHIDLFFCNAEEVNNCKQYLQCYWKPFTFAQQKIHFTFTLFPVLSCVFVLFSSNCFALVLKFVFVSFFSFCLFIFYSVLLLLLSFLDAGVRLFPTCSKCASLLPLFPCSQT